MFRVLVRTPRRRLAGLVLVVALAWTAWALWPPAPEARWSLAEDEGNRALFTADGRTAVTGRILKGGVAVNGEPVSGLAGPLVGRDAETGRERYRLFESFTALSEVRITPDGRRLVARANRPDFASTDLLVIDPADGRPLAALTDIDFNVESYPGSIGQPRDGDSRAAFAIADLEHQVVEFWRVPYDVEAVQQRMRAAHLPEPLVQRLAVGR